MLRRFALVVFAAALWACGPATAPPDGGATDGGASCLPGRACNAPCRSTAQCGLDEACVDGLCGHVAPTSSAYAACALDADCPRGDFCRLGACSHDCLADRDCSGGTVCSDRGRCVAESAVSQPPPTPAPSKGVPAVTPTALDFPLGAATQSLVLGNAGGEPFDFRVLSSHPAFSVSPFDGRVSGQSVTLTVTVDRTALGETDAAFLAINTTAGFVRVPIGVASNLTAAWTGAFEVAAPVALGEHTAVFNLSEDGSGNVTGFVHGDLSALWPINAGITGSTSVDGGVQRVAFGFRLPAPQGSAANPSVPLTLERLVAVDAIRTASGRMEGTFVETIKGLGSADVQVTGQVVLSRTGGLRDGSAVADTPVTVGPVSNPFIDGTGATRADYQACLTCPGAACGSSAVDNGDRFLTYRVSASTPVLAMKFYDEFWQLAQSPATGTPFTAVDACAWGGCGTARTLFDPFYLRCAQYWYAAAARAGDSSGATRLLDTLQLPADAAMYAGNASVAAAFDAWFRPTSTLYQQEQMLATAVSAQTSGLFSNAATPIAMADPAIASLVAGFSVSQVAGPQPTVLPIAIDRGPGEAVRRALLTVNGLMFASFQRASVLRRQGADDQARLRLRESFVTAYLAEASLGQIVSKSPTTWTPTLAEAKTRWQDLGRSLTELVEGRNLLGYSPGYVPFFWNKDSPGTNYQQIKATADMNLSVWATLYQDSNNAARSYEASASALQSELNQQGTTIDSQVREICGAAVTTVEQCGADFGAANASLVAQQLLEVQASALRVQQVVTQMRSLYDEIRIEESRAAQVAGVHQNNAQLIRQTGQRVNAADRAIRQINAAQQVANDIFGGVTGAFAGGNPLQIVGALLGGIMHAVVDGSTAVARERYENDKAEALVDQQSQLEFSVAKVELINSAAAIKVRLLQINSLKLELDLAMLNVAQTKGRLRALYERAEGLLADKARATALTGDSARRAIHYRVYANYTARQAIEAQRTALQWGFLAARALEYQLNAPIDLAGLWSARSPNDLTVFLQQLQNLAASTGSAQSRTEVISLRDKVLGLNTPIAAVDGTGALVAPRERFRQFVMSPANRDAQGNFHIRFTTADDANPIFSSLLASDRIRSVKVNLVGDSLGAGVTTAYVQLVHGGTSYLRSRMKGTGGVAPLIAYDVSGKSNQPRLAIVQAGVNAPNSNPQVPDNIELQERAVLAGPWELVIDQTASTPANANLDLSGLDDIEVIVTHDAYTIQ